MHGKALPALLGALVLLGACSDEPRARPIPVFDGNDTADYPGCEEFTMEPCDVSAEACQRDLFRLASCLWGTTGARRPDTVVLSPGEASDYLAELLDRAGVIPDERAFLASQRALGLIGLQETILSFEELIEVEANLPLALYAFEDERVVVIDRGNLADDGVTNSILIHEYVHALQDAQFDLGAFSDDELSSEESLAFRAVVEGGAFVYQVVAEAMFSGIAATRLRWERILGPLVEEVEAGVLTEPDPLLESGAIFPYSHGALYMSKFWVTGDPEPMKRVYPDPPRATQNIMAAGVATEHAADPYPEGSEPEPLEGSLFQGADQLGAWFVYLFLGRHSTDPAEAREAALDVVRNETWSYDDPVEDRVALIWKIEWARESSAERFRAVVAERGDESWAAVRDGNTTFFVAAEATDDVSAWQARTLGPEADASAAAAVSAGPALRRFRLGDLRPGHRPTCSLPAAREDLTTIR